MDIGVEGFHPSLETFGEFGHFVDFDRIDPLFTEKFVGSSRRNDLVPQADQGFREQSDIRFVAYTEQSALHAVPLYGSCARELMAEF